MTATGRSMRADAADASCAAAFARALRGSTSRSSGMALVAVGGYGRRELAPQSDLDLVLVHDADADPGGVATELWYPLWDSGVRLDHAVRALPDTTADAERDVRVALGLLDARHVAGDPSVALRLRATALAAWRRNARGHARVLAELARSRHERHGELAHTTSPDLKESAGGLRDATVLRVLVATWPGDVPHDDLERSRRALLDVRDALHLVSGRRGDRVAPEVWNDLAARLGDDCGEVTQRRVREHGRRIGHLSRLTWWRLDGRRALPGGGGRRRVDGTRAAGAAHAVRAALTAPATLDP